MLRKRIALGCANISMKMLEVCVEIEKKSLEKNRKKVSNLINTIRQQKINIKKGEDEIAQRKLRVSYMKADIVSDNGNIVGETTALVVA